MSPIPYRVHGVAVAIDDRTVVQIPARVFRARLTGNLFETDKAFLLPTAFGALRGLVGYCREHAGLPLCITAHTDGSGDGRRSRALCDERADVLAAWLRGDAAAWLAFYRSPAGSRPWGTREDQFMLAAVNLESPLRGGPPTGEADALTADAFAAFQRAAGLPATGRADDATRAALVTRYLNRPGTRLPTGATVVTHGCGEGHPALADAAGKPEPRNCRVEVFLFEGRAVDPPAVPTCPAAGCASYDTWLARTVETVNFGDDAPEYLAPFLVIEMLGEDGAPLGGIAYSVTLSDGSVRDGALDAEGRARLSPVPPGLCKVRFPVLDAEAWEALAEEGT